MYIKKTEKTENILAFFDVKTTFITASITLPYTTKKKCIYHYYPYITPLAMQRQKQIYTPSLYYNSLKFEEHFKISCCILTFSS